MGIKAKDEHCFSRWKGSALADNVESYCSAYFERLGESKNLEKYFLELKSYDCKKLKEAGVSSCQDPRSLSSAD